MMTHDRGLHKATSRIARDERGQAFTEYTMMLGLLTAIIAWLTLLIVPGFGRMIVAFVKHVAVYVSSV